MQVPNGWFIRKISKIYWKVRNEAADDFLSLIKEWQNLCNQFGLLGSPRNEDTSTKSEECDIEENEDNRDLSDGEFEVGKLVAICYGQPNNDGISKLHFKLVPRSYVCGLRSSSYIDCVAFDPLALRLLQRMLAFDPKERPTAKRL